MAGEESSDSRAPDLMADLMGSPTFAAACQDDRFADACIHLILGRKFYKSSDKRGWSCAVGEIAGIQAALSGRAEGKLRRARAVSRYGGYWTEERESRQRGRAWRERASGREEFWPPERLGDAEFVARFRTHLSQLGWRRSTVEDDRREYLERLDGRLLVMSEIDDLEGHAEFETPIWALPILTEMRTRMSVRDHLSSDPISKSEWNQMSAAEREAMPCSKKLEQRLDELAVTGRISKDEYEGLKRRL